MNEVEGHFVHHSPTARVELPSAEGVLCPQSHELSFRERVQWPRRQLGGVMLEGGIEDVALVGCHQARVGAQDVFDEGSARPGKAKHEHGRGGCHRPAGGHLDGPVGGVVEHRCIGCQLDLLLVHGLAIFLCARARLVAGIACPVW